MHERRFLPPPPHHHHLHYFETSHFLYQKEIPHFGWIVSIQQFLSRRNILNLQLIHFIINKLSLSCFCNFFFVSSQAGTWNRILTDFHTLTIFKEYLKEKSFEILANHTSSKYWQNWKYWQNKRSKYWLNFKIVHELSKCCKK